MKTALVLGAGGFIGSHMVKRLKSEGFYVRGVDLKYPEFNLTAADEFIIGDLRNLDVVKSAIEFSSSDNSGFEEIYQFAADMGGAGFVFSGENDAEIMHNSASINLNLLETVKSYSNEKGNYRTKIFYSSSACMYPAYNQENIDNLNLSEESAYPAAPDSEYGWEKLFSERLFLAYKRNHNLNVCIARYHNIFGPEGTWKGGREKAPAAICRKVAMVDDGGEIEIWGDGEQTRSFLYIDECIEATRRLMNSQTFFGPVNIGSEEMVTINQLVEIASSIAKKHVKIRHVEGPIGVRGRNSDNQLIKEKLGWDYELKLSEGLKRTYKWIHEQVGKDLKF